jgi:hypothetical protein
MCGHTRRDRIRNEVIHDRLGVAPIDEKLLQHRLWWFGHIQRRPPEAPTNSAILRSMEENRRGRGQPKLTWVEAVKETWDWNVPKVLALDRTAWRSAIHVPES